MSLKLPLIDVNLGKLSYEKQNGHLKTVLFRVKQSASAWLMTASVFFANGVDAVCGAVLLLGMLHSNMDCIGYIIP